MRLNLWAAFGVLAAFALTFSTGRAFAQGCTAARGCPTIPAYMPRNNNPFMVQEDLSAAPAEGEESLDVAPDEVRPRRRASGGGFLLPGQVIASYQYNYADADKIFLGDNNHLVGMDQAVALSSIQNEHTMGIETGLGNRLSLVYELPFQYNDRSLNVGPMSPDLTGRLVQNSGGIADSRLYLRKWLFNSTDANISVYAGVKIPTGDEDSGGFYQTRFLYDDISIQTGTGSWDPIFGFFFYRRSDIWTAFGGFNYRVTPEANTSALALDPLLGNPNSTIRNAVADQLSGTLGLSCGIGEWLYSNHCGGCALRGLSSSFAVAVAAVPERDMINDPGDYRRAFNAVFLVPGINWQIKKDLAFYGTLPVTVHRNLTVPGSFADVTYSTGLTYNW